MEVSAETVAFLTPPPGGQFTSLNSDIGGEIVSFLKIADTSSLALVNSHWQERVNQDSRWAPIGAPPSVSVFLRIRPEKRGTYTFYPTLPEGDDPLTLLPDHKTIIQLSQTGENGRGYMFDWVWKNDGNGPCTQEEVFQRVARPIVRSVFKGCNGTVMAYGQVNSGKSFSMGFGGISVGFNRGQGEGMMMQSVKYIFKRVKADTDRVYTVSCSFIHVYMDEVQDLLNGTARHGPAALKVEYSDAKGVHFPGIVECVIKDASDFKDQFVDADQHDVRGPSKFKYGTNFFKFSNMESSRSHRVVFINVKSVPAKNPGFGETTSGRLCLLSCGGYQGFTPFRVPSEKSKEEAKAINASLLALGNCVSALSDPEGGVIPWRNSILTRILQGGIGATNSKCAILLTASPSNDHHHETTGTLYFGSRAMQIEKEANREKEVRARLVRFYNAHNQQDKLSGVEKLLRTHRSKEEDLFKKLVDKYGPEPKFTPTTVTQAPPPSTETLGLQDSLLLTDGGDGGERTILPFSASCSGRPLRLLVLPPQPSACPHLQRSWTLTTSSVHSGRSQALTMQHWPCCRPVRWRVNGGGVVACL